MDEFTEKPDKYGATSSPINGLNMFWNFLSMLFLSESIWATNCLGTSSYGTHTTFNEMLALICVNNKNILQSEHSNSKGGFQGFHAGGGV